MFCVLEILVIPANSDVKYDAVEIVGAPNFCISVLRKQS